jgi:hypothetical protein
VACSPGEIHDRFRLGHRLLAIFQSSVVPELSAPSFCRHHVLFGAGTVGTSFPSASHLINKRCISMRSQSGDSRTRERTYIGSA